MILEVSSVGMQPVVGSVSDLLISTASPVALAIQLGQDERLDGASLVVRRTEGSGLASPSILVDTGSAGGMVGVQWMTAAWGETRELRGLTVNLAAASDRVRVRVMVARADGSWQQPPGAIAVTTEGKGLRVELDDTWADRVRVELLDEHGRPAAMMLDERDPLELDLGNEPRDLSLRVHGGEPLLRWSGEIPREGLMIGDLVALLGPELMRGRHGPLVIELRAEVAGDLELRWDFSTAKASADGLAAE